MAHTTARQVGEGRNHGFTAFGPTNVAPHRVAASVRLHDGARAIEAAEAIPEPQLTSLPRERRAELFPWRGLTHNAPSGTRPCVPLRAWTNSPRGGALPADSRELLEQLLRFKGPVPADLHRLATAAGLVA